MGVQWHMRRIDRPGCSFITSRSSWWSAWRSACDAVGSAYRWSTRSSYRAAISWTLACVSSLRINSANAVHAASLSWSSLGSTGNGLPRGVPRSTLLSSVFSGRHGAVRPFARKLPTWMVVWGRGCGTRFRAADPSADGGSFTSSVLPRTCCAAVGVSRIGSSLAVT